MFKPDDPFTFKVDLDSKLGKLHAVVREAISVCCKSISEKVERAEANAAAKQKKRHKKKTFHKQVKVAPTGKLATFMDRVTDPDKEERFKEMMKNPFKGLG